MNTPPVNHRYCGWRESVKLVVPTKLSLADLAELVRRLGVADATYDATYPALLARLRLMTISVDDATGAVTAVTDFASLAKLVSSGTTTDHVVGINTIQSARLLLDFAQRNL